MNSTNARVADSGQATAGNEANRSSAEQTQRGMKVSPTPGRSGNDARVPPAGDRVNAREGQGRQAMPAARNTPPPPSVPRAVTNERVFNQNNAGGGQGGGRMGSAGAGASSGASRGSAPSAGASSGGARSSGGGSAGGSSGGGGGRPH